LPPLGRFVDIDGGRIHYLEQGSGPTLLLIHGLGGQMRNFAHSLLERLKNNYRLIILDRPGSGYSTRPPGASATIRGHSSSAIRWAAQSRSRSP
jgi:pimeloyl-ACP methyl ester carboxylesterase